MKKNWDNMFESELWYTGLEPCEFVTKNMKSAAKSNSVLDVGCGCGRHTVFLSEQGYDVYGIDISSVALNRTKERLDSLDLSATLKQCNMWDIPFDDVKFSTALCANVLNHAMPSEIQSTVSGIANKLMDNGVFLLTLLTDNDYRKCGEQVDVNTFICDRGPEAGVLHTFFSESCVREFLESRFEIVLIEVVRGKHEIEDGGEVKTEFFQIKAKKKMLD